MANILALDTSTDACSVALQVGEQRTEIFKVIPRRHTHELLPMVKEILAQAQLNVKQLDAIAFGRGPGSFAGIRIATGVTQGLAFAEDLAVIPVSTLATLAQGYYRVHGDDTHQIITALDARMDEVYWGSYCIDQGLAKLVTQEAVCAPSDVTVNSDAKYVAIGSGFNYQSQMSDEVNNLITNSYADFQPHSLDMLAIANQQFIDGNTVSAEQAQPVYLRNQVAWKKKDQQ